MEEEIAQFLAHHPPFSLVPFEDVQPIARTVKTRQFPPGSDVLIYGGEPAEHLYVVRTGSVDLLHEDGRGFVTLFDTLGVGEVFGHASLIRRRPPDVTIRSREATLTYLLPAETFHHLWQTQPAFANFFEASSLERLTRRIEARAAAATAEFRTRLRDLLQPQPIMMYVEPGTSVRATARLMREHKLTCVVVDTDPPGIVTDRDLRDRVLAEGLNDATPIEQVMTAPVQSLPADSLVFEGLMTMLERRVRHLPISENGRIIGVITNADILRQQSESPLLLPRQLMRARRLEDMRSYAEQVTRTVGSMLDAGARVQDIGRFVAVSHDALLERLLRDAEAEMGPPPCPYAWLVLGSEGRYEQTLRTDQDNALVYADDAPRRATDYFTALAERIVEQLVFCGFPRCPGDVMATNPQWCQPLHVWQSYFQTWIHTPDEEALLRSTIFFDYRRVHGKLDVDQALRPIIRAGSRQPIFLNRLAKDALRQSPPLSFFRGLVVERDGAGREVIDLKARGTALIVDLARLFGLKTACDATNTITRLRLAAPLSDLSAEGAEELIAAFELVSLLRLRHQYTQLQRREEPTNLVQVGTLSPLERRELKDALRAVGRIQRSVESLFGTTWIA